MENHQSVIVYITDETMGYYLLGVHKYYQKLVRDKSIMVSNTYILEQTGLNIEQYGHRRHNHIPPEGE